MSRPNIRWGPALILLAVINLVVSCVCYKCETIQCKGERHQPLRR